MELVTQVQILVEAVCILLHANAFEKGMNQSVLPSSWADCFLKIFLLLFFFKIVFGNQYRRKKTLNSNQLDPA